VCSPLLSNIYLDPLDHLMAKQGFGDGALRGRLCGVVSQLAGRRRGLGGGAAMDGTARQYAARGDSSPTAFDPESETIAAAALIAVNRELRRVVSGGF